MYGRFKWIAPCYLSTVRDGICRIALNLTAVSAGIADRIEETTHSSRREIPGASVRKSLIILPGELRKPAREASFAPFRALYGNLWRGWRSPIV